MNMEIFVKILRKMLMKLKKNFLLNRNTKIKLYLSSNYKLNCQPRATL